MKVLEIFGDDYAALAYENLIAEGEIEIDKLWEYANKNGEQIYEDGENCFEYSAFEFGEVDPKFVEFIHNHVIDYDDSKHYNFYVL